MRNPEFVKSFFTAIAPRYVATNHVLSLGIDLLWRQRVVQLVAEWQPATLLDLATGTGDLALALLNAMPQIHLIGSDFCQSMLDIAATRGLKNLVCADALALPFANESFNTVTVAFGLRNMASYTQALQEMHRVLLPDGHLLILDFAMPQNPLIYPYRFYLHKILPRIAGIMTGCRQAYDYLGDSIEKFPCGSDMLQLIESCGFNNTRAESLNGGIACIYTAQR